MTYRIHIFFLLIFILFISSCGKKKRSISVVCEEGLKGNYEIKWDIYPEPTDARVDIFATDNDTVFFSNPTVVARSDDYIAVVNAPDSASRQYFKLKVEGISSGIVSNRFFIFDSIQNFRDIGGYYTVDNRQVRWGKLFRSGLLSKATERDLEKIKKLHIKTNIDINMQCGNNIKSNPLQLPNFYCLPIGHSGFELIAPKIQENRFLRGDAVIYMQDFYKDIVENSSDEYSRFFDHLCNEANYPIVYNCYLGKVQSGIATYLILRALDVPTETIEEDFLASNKGIDKHKLGYNVDNLSESGQEAMTLITNTDVSYLRFALACIRKKYGSIESYMEKELKITNEKKQKLRQILLYPQNEKK